MPYIFILLAFLFLLVISNYINKDLSILFFILITIISAVRFMNGWDYSAYYETIVYGRVTNIVLRNETFSMKLIELSRSLDYWQLYFIVSSCLTGFFIYKSFQKNDRFLSSFLFTAFPLFYFNSYSVIRIFVGISLVFYAFSKHTKLIPRIIIILIATQFHESAWFSFLFFLIPNKKISITKILSFSTFFILFKSVVISVLAKVLPSFSTYFVVTSRTEGTRTIYLYILLAIPVLINYLKNDIDSKSVYHTNIFLFSTIFYAAFLNYGTLGHRTSLYGCVFILNLFPKSINDLWIGKDRFIVKMVVYTFLTCLYFYSIFIARGTLVPYRTFLTD